jgi:DNA (cytosine-5)-methyltransferase 1
LKVLSLYSGADNLGDGVIQAGHDVKLAIEINNDCCRTIKLNHPDTEVINGKVSDHLESLGRFDCVIGGPPCPEFSRAKSDRTFDLCEVNNFIRAREITKAEFHLMENVQDLYQVYKERNFLVNCADYGVPQTRIRRIFTNLPLPKQTHSKTPSEDLFGGVIKKWVSVKDALNISDGIILDKTQQCWKQKIPLYNIDSPHPTLLVDGSDNGLWFISNSGHSTRNREDITRSIDEPADTIVCASSVQISNYPIKSQKKIRNRLDKINGTSRKLTNEELAILQGFRSDFKFYGGKTSVRKQIGNALPAVISKAFFKELS